MGRLPRIKKQKAPKSKGPKGIGGFFLRGLITVLPVVLTFVVFGLLFQMVDRYVTGPINSTIYWTLEGNALGWKSLERMGIDPLDQDYLDPEALPIELKQLGLTVPKGYIDPEFQEGLSLYRNQHLSFFRNLEELAIREDRLRTDVKNRVHPLIGVVVSLLLVLWLGWLVGGFLGRRFIHKLDQTMQLIPIVKSVYPYSKQLVEFFFAEKQIDFDTVVALPYPSPGIWSIGFVTSGSLKTLREDTGRDLVSVFVPSSPMPMTGYTVFVEMDRVTPLPISVDEALRITMTGGVLIPPREKVEDLAAELEAARGAMHDDARDGAEEDETNGADA